MKVIERVEPSPWVKQGIKLPDLSGSRAVCEWCSSLIAIELPLDILDVHKRPDGSVYFSVACPVCHKAPYLDLDQVTDKRLPGVPLARMDELKEKPSIWPTWDEWLSVRPVLIPWLLAIFLVFMIIIQH